MQFLFVATADFWRFVSFVLDTQAYVVLLWTCWAAFRIPFHPEKDPAFSFFRAGPKWAKKEITLDESADHSDRQGLFLFSLSI